MRITNVYTRKGDGGQTQLGGGQRLNKDNTRINAFGTVDELNSVIGIALTFEPTAKVAELLTQIQHELFVLGSDLCVLESDKDESAFKGIGKERIVSLENEIDSMNSVLKPLEEFILPGGSTVSAFLHQARCICRRAERISVELSHEEEIGAQVIPYLNRLSDLLFVLARYQNLKTGNSDVYWQRTAK